MGIIDPMLIGNVATGVVEFGNGHTVWLALMGVLGGAAFGIVMSVWHQVRAALPQLPRFSHAPLVAAGTAAVK